MPKHSSIALPLALSSLMLSSPAYAMGSSQKSQKSQKSSAPMAYTSPVKIRDELMKALYQSMNTVEDGGIVGLDLDVISNDLKGAYESLPKLDNEGYLSGSAARYLVHTFFRKELGWLIKGLEPGSDPFNAANYPKNSSKRRALRANQGIPTAIPDNWRSVPSLLLSILDKKMHRMFFPGVLTFAGVLGNLILNEGADRLELAYALNDFNDTNTVMLNEADLDRVLDSYMTLLSVQRHESVDKAQHALDMAEVHEMWAHFPQLQTFSHDALKTLAFIATAVKNPFVERTYSFDEAWQVVIKMSQTYGKTRDIQCQELKEGLMEMDPLATGRVHLGHFYAKKAIGPWSLTESRNYLRQLGALDETAQEDAQVIISNYMNAVSNCDSTSEFYSICCINECDQILNRIEDEILAPTAPVHRVMEVVTQLSSGTIEAPRNLSMPLISALEQAAAQNNGNVTLHSRLFAQWLHYAFPHECPYPYMSGRVQALTPSQYESENGQAFATEDEIVSTIANLQGQNISISQTEGEQPQDAAEAVAPSMSMWTFEDELVTLDSLQILGNLGSKEAEVMRQTQNLQTMLQLVAFVCGPIAFLAAILWQRLSPVLVPQGKAEKL